MLPRRQVEQALGAVKGGLKKIRAEIFRPCVQMVPCR